MNNFLISLSHSLTLGEIISALEVQGEREGEREKEIDRHREKEIDRARRSKQNFRISTLRCLLLRPSGLFKLK